jgi:putative ABC transport system ATP-binding protein
MTQLGTAEELGTDMADGDDSSMPVVEAKELVRVFEGEGGERRALDGVNLEVPAGRMLSIMGPSGSGKSTLLHLLGGLDRPTSGEVLLDGKPLSGLSDRELTLVRRRRIGFVFQSFNLVPVLTVEENVGYPLVLDGWRDEKASKRVDEVLQLVGLADRRGQRANALSGGEQQRTAIARALVFDPPIVLADEPTGNLDSRTGGDVMDALRAAQRELGRTVIVVTHDPRVAATSDEVVELRDGHVLGRLDLRSGRRGRRSAEQVVNWLGRQS